jgi:DNA (cytosine-5)-methyltransferase 1
MRHGSLFSGIGGFDLAAEWMGWENKFHCEWNPFGQRVLKHYWPNAESFNDITKTDFKKYANKIDILTGGFPCQPYSSAGKRLGKEDERHLWPEMLRAIREISPSYVVGENVRGLTNWNGGMVFDEVCAELESYGYQVAPCIIPACGVGAPHRRERIWFVAYADSSTKRPSRTSGDVETNRSKNNDEQSGRRESAKFNIRRGEFLRDVTDTNGNGFDKRNCNDEVNTSQRGEYALGDIDKSNGNGDVADTNGERLQRGQNPTGWKKYDTKRAGTSFEFRAENENINGKFRSNFQNFPTQSPICSGDDGISTELDGITFSKWRAESIKAYGNAIVPQVAYQIFKAIQLTNENTGH